MQSLQEALADKLIALAYRARRIKPRDIWDLVWIKQRGISLSKELVEKKLSAINKQTDDFRQTLAMQLAKLMQEGEVHDDFNMEISRFIPEQIKQRTLDNPEYWTYVQAEVKEIATELLNDNAPKNKFDMGW
ncbi:nucleotidyl transferase AbiEii/AbiGii toxin family protein [Lacimicrobium alkaliphilum]|uniref:nucleotidyl transferase AbiEii/AbiGii toxin family protein n=1 Tax=Lacimicrobium alkaliphilum TaxID=1526571 RepID=UPI000A6BD347